MRIDSPRLPTTTLTLWVALVTGTIAVKHVTIDTNLTMSKLTYGTSLSQTSLSVNVACLENIRQDDDDIEAIAKDAKKVMALMRLKSMDVNQRPELKQTVLRHLKRSEGDVTQWLKFAERFELPETGANLFKIASTASDDSQATLAIRLLVKLNQIEKITSAIQSQRQEDPELELENRPTANDAASPPESKAALAAEKIAGLAQLATRLGLAEDESIQSWMRAEILESNRYPQAIANTLVRALVRTRTGATFVLDLAEKKTLPSSVRLAAAEALSRHRDEKIKSQAVAILPPPTSSQKPLSPIAELVNRTGDVEDGRKVFFGTGTCNKCHVVGKEGVSVGPDLSEIGSKLSPDAMYTSIIDPSAAISHNYENYAVQTIDGKLLTGLLVSETEDEVILKSPEGVPTSNPTQDIEQMKKLDVSLMPSDLIRVMSQDDLIDLVEYLSTLKKVN